MALQSKKFTQETSQPLKLTLTNQRKDTQHICLFNAYKMALENVGLHNGLVLVSDHNLDDDMPSYSVLSEGTNKEKWIIGMVNVESTNYLQVAQPLYPLDKGESIQSFGFLNDANKQGKMIAPLHTLKQESNKFRAYTMCGFEIGNGQDIYCQLAGETTVEIFLYPSEKIKK